MLHYIQISKLKK